MKKTKLLFASTISVVICLGISIAISNNNAVMSIIGEVNSENTIWGHYDAVEPQYEKPGSKEFWISCDDHSIVYEAPEVGKIEDRGAPTVETIISWGSEDNRYIPQYKIDSKTIWYGYYPQSVIKKEAIIKALNAISEVDSNGYKSYNGDKYFNWAGVKYTSNDNKTVSVGDYYYKVERIEWKILSSNSSSVFVTSKYILDQYRFGEKYTNTKSKTDYQDNTATVYANNYKYSDLRTFFNTTFLNQAFDDASKILTSNVDNSAASAEGWNPYACENTSDKVFALSYKDLTTTSYGFLSETGDADAARKCRTSEFARARGVFYNASGTNIFNGTYQTRSPYSDASDKAWYTNKDGTMSVTGVAYTSAGVRPAMNISIA